MPKQKRKQNPSKPKSNSIKKAVGAQKSDVVTPPTPKQLSVPSDCDNVARCPMTIFRTFTNIMCIFTRLVKLIDLFPTCQTIKTRSVHFARVAKEKFVLFWNELFKWLTLIYVLVKIWISGIIQHVRRQRPSPSFTTDRPSPATSISGENPESWECHVDWVQEFIFHGFATPDEQKDYLRRLLIAEESVLKSYATRVFIPGTPLLARLTIAALHAHLQEYDTALEWINGAAEYLMASEVHRSEHKKALGCLVLINWWKIQNMSDPNNGSKPKELTFVETTSKQEKGNGAFKAMLCVAKGILAGKMKCRDAQIHYLRKATALEGLDCAHWHRLLYHALREERREGIWWREPPSGEERQAIIIAFKIDPDFCQNQSSFANMLDETLKLDRLNSKTRKERGTIIVVLLWEALAKNPDDLWTHVRLAEIYSYGHFPHLNSDIGEQLFRECEKRYPSSSMVFHKIGRYFAIKNELHTAKNYFLCSLQRHPGNVPCLMDYLTACGKLGNDISERIEKIEMCLENRKLHWAVPFTKMQVGKGILLWMKGNTEAACHAWVEAGMAEAKTSFRGYVAKMLFGDYWRLVGEYSIEPLKDLQDILEGFQRDAYIEGKLSSYEGIKSLLMDIGNTRKYRSHRNAWESSSESSEASSSTNWRERSSQGSNGPFSHFNRNRDGVFKRKNSSETSSVTSADVDENWRG